MNWHDKDEIIAKSDCLEIAKTFLGLKVEDKRCAAIWRGGKGNNVALSKEGWYDHKEKKGGNVIQLVMMVKNINFAEGCEVLGEYLHLPRSIEIKEGRKKTGEFIYNDANGKPLHKTVRYKMPDGDKDFCQYRFEKNEWQVGLGDVQTVPYHLDKMMAFDTWIVHEGEGKCDCAIEHGIVNSTCLCLGAGKWFPSWGQYFKDRNVVIVRDNDDAGYAHGARLAWELKTIAKSIKVITPSKVTKGDCYEYFHDEGGTKESFEKMVADAPVLDAREIQEPRDVKDSIEEQDAKSANRTEFMNHTMREGKEGKKFPVSRLLNDMTKDIRKRLMGFPKKCGGQLFDIDKKTGKHKEIRDHNELIAWIAEKTGKNPKFKENGGDGFMSARVLFSALHKTSEEFELIADSPHWPPIANVYYQCQDLPEPTPDAYYFNKFCTFFCGASYEDSLLIKVCVASLFYFEQKCDKPMWIIDTTEGAGQGTGKTKFTEMLAYLLNSEPFWISPTLFKVNDAITQLNRRLLSTDGRRKRIFVIDNVECYFKSPELASYVTQGSFSGMAPYGKGETSRINDLNFFITSNGGTFDRDIIDRSMIIHLDKPKTYNDNWIIDIMNFIKAHRLQIASDIIHIMKQGHQLKIKPQTRFKIWEQKVLMPIMSNISDYEAVISHTKSRRTKSDGELERAEVLKDHFYNRISQIDFWHDGKHKCDPENDWIWIESPVLTKWCQEAIPGFGGIMGGHCTYILKQMHKTGLIPELSTRIEKWPKYINHKNDIAEGKPDMSSRIGKKRGMFWNGDKYIQECIGKDKATQKQLTESVLIFSSANDGNVFVKNTDLNPPKENENGQQG